VDQALTGQFIRNFSKISLTQKAAATRVIWILLWPKPKCILRPVCISFLGLFGTCKYPPHAFLNPLQGDIGAHARTAGSHYPPVSWIHQNTFDKRPGPAHPGLDGMNRTKLVPENTISIFFLSQQWSFAGHIAVAVDKMLRLHTDITADGFNILVAYVSSPISFTAVTTLTAGKKLCGLTAVT
jgi:hypothetical protein